jgi:hypothetical protein
MVDLKEIVSCFEGFIGFKEEKGFSEADGFDGGLFRSESGLHFQSAHPLITYLNMRDCCEDEDTSNNAPAFSEWLGRKRDDALKNAFARLWQKKRLYEQTKTVLEETRLFSSPANVGDRVIKLGRFVGFQVSASRDVNVATVLKKIGLQFTERQAGLPIYVYHSSRDEALAMRTVDVSNANTPVWQGFDFTLKYDNGEKDFNTVWFIGYYEDDLTGQALSLKTDGGSGGCGSCGGREKYYQREYNKYITVSPFYVDSGNLRPDRRLWDIPDMVFDKKHSWGLNFKVSAQCDLTALICSNRELFLNMYYYQFAVLMLSEIGYSTRNNERKEKVKVSALFDLDDRENGGSTGMKTLAEREIDAVNIDFSGLSPLCLPCARSKIRYNTIM